MHTKFAVTVEAAPNPPNFSEAVQELRQALEQANPGTVGNSDIVDWEVEVIYDD